jgi:hypothetical protein
MSRLESEPLARPNDQERRLQGRSAHVVRRLPREASLQHTNDGCVMTRQLTVRQDDVVGDWVHWWHIAPLGAILGIAGQWAASTHCDSVLSGTFKCANVLSGVLGAGFRTMTPGDAFFIFAIVGVFLTIGAKGLLRFAASISAEQAPAAANGTQSAPKIPAANRAAPLEERGPAESTAPPSGSAATRSGSATRDDQLAALFAALPHVINGRQRVLGLEDRLTARYSGSSGDDAILQARSPSSFGLPAGAGVTGVLRDLASSGRVQLSKASAVNPPSSPTRIFGTTLANGHLTYVAYWGAANGPWVFTALADTEKMQAALCAAIAEVSRRSRAGKPAGSAP